MKQHILRIKLNEDGQWADIPFYATALGLAIKQAEALYGVTVGRVTPGEFSKAVILVL